jgi:hypothetical protein
LAGREQGSAKNHGIKSGSVKRSRRVSAAKPTVRSDEEKAELKTSRGELVDMPDGPFNRNAVIAFPGSLTPRNALTFNDQLEIDRWRHHLRGCGFPRIEIHHREDSDPPDIQNFAAFYRADSAWSSFGFARQGPEVMVWQSHGKEFGRFGSIGDALLAILPIASQQAAPTGSPPKRRRKA